MSANATNRQAPEPVPWSGPPCFMCEYTGVDRNGGPCRSCNGHRRQATTDPHSPSKAEVVAALDVLTKADPELYGPTCDRAREFLSRYLGGAA